MSSPLVSFIVPCYNYGRYLPECLASIFGQERRVEFEVIAIDDGSTDHTPDVLAAVRDPRLRLVRHARNLGHVATINEAIGLARGRYVARIDPDDRYRPCFLGATLPVLERFPDVGMVYGDVALIDESGRITRERCDQAHQGRDFKGNELVRLLESNFICAPTVLARRELWVGALPVPERLAFNDWYFTLWMARRTDFYYRNQVLADYRVHSANHHQKIVLDGSEEPSIFFLLDRIFSEREPRAELEEPKRRSRNRIYAAQYLDLANKYFGAGMSADARRCYLRAVRHRPRYLAQPGVLRRLFATLVGRSLYDRIKGAVQACPPLTRAKGQR